MKDANNAVYDVEAVREVLDFDVEGAGHDGEYHVQEEEDGGEPEQRHVEIRLSAGLKKKRWF